MIISKLGAVAYKLQLPETSHIHPIFHVSQLKCAIGSVTVQPTLPLEFEGDKLEWVPKEVLASRTIQ